MAMSYRSKILHRYYLQGICVLFYMTGILLIFGCTTSRKLETGVEETKVTASPVSAPAKDDIGPRKISRVSARPKVFDPSRGEEVEISFSLARNAKITVKMYDSTNQLIKTLCRNKEFEQGKNTVNWDGKDGEGNIVPDEAYIYTIVAEAGGKRVVFDPADRTRGIRVLAEKIKYNPEEKEIDYFLPRAARVRLRVGIKDGPLLGSIVDWEPRSAGRKSEPWDGMDELGTIKLYDRPDLEISISAYTLPRNCVITNGNKVSSKFVTVEGVEKRRSNPIPPFTHRHAKHALPFCHAPRFSLAIEKGDRESEGSIPIVSGQVPIRIEVDPEDRNWLIRNRFEIMIYVDNIFFFEEEEGYTPFTYFWDTRGIKPGRHVITANISDYEGHVGTQSLLLDVK